MKHQESIAIGVFSFFLLFTLGFHILLYFPLDQSPDIQTYLALAQWDFDQSEIRKYRVLIPLFAGFIDFLFHPLFDAIAPWTFHADFSLCLSFLLINTGLMTITAVLLYKICKCYTINKAICGIALLAFVSNRWTLEACGLPLVDSLYLLTIVSSFYGLILKKPTFIFFSIFIGPWAKEAYVFMIPMLLLYGFPKRMNLCLGLILSACIVFSFRYLLDQYTGHSWSSSLGKDLDSFQTIPQSLNRLFSFHGLYELYSAAGPWIIFPVAALLFHFHAFMGQIMQHGKILFLAYLPFVLLQALLSADLGRMFYLAIPLVIITVAVSLDLWSEKWEPVEREKAKG